MNLLKKIIEEIGSKFQTIPLVEYLKKGLKTRGDGKNGTLSSHLEKFITSDGSIVDISKINEYLPSDFQLIGLDSIGNPFQMITAVVQGFNPDNSNSGFERPVLAEGPHMVIGVYAFDDLGQIHIFRTLQLRTGRLIIDTPRGFCPQTMLENGEQIYDTSPEKVIETLRKILKEETGDILQIKGIHYLGADIINTSCVTSKSALFAVEVDYKKFLQLSTVLTTDEFQRRQEQMQHEGLLGTIIDFLPEEYLSFSNSPDIIKDMAADTVSNRIMMNYFANNLEE